MAVESINEWFENYRRDSLAPRQSTTFYWGKFRLCTIRWRSIDQWCFSILLSRRRYLDSGGICYQGLSSNLSRFRRAVESLGRDGQLPSISKNPGATPSQR